LDISAVVPEFLVTPPLMGPVCILNRTRFKAELCADELVVGGGVEWSYDRRRRRWRRQTG